LSPSDQHAVAAQLGREPRGAWRVTARCAAGLPQAITVAPTLEDGSPFPTTFWLTCPRLVEAVSAQESGGVHHRWTERATADPALAERMLAADEAYRTARRAEGADERLAGVGVAGQRDPLAVKCLHARVAARLSGIDDPVGEAVLSEVHLEEPCGMRDRCGAAQGTRSRDVSEKG
jgi:hypothetical protein